MKPANFFCNFIAYPFHMWKKNDTFASGNSYKPIYE